MDIPNELRLALDAELAAVPARDLSAAVAALSQRYRERGASGEASTEPAPGSGGALLRSEADIAAYAAYRLPATFAVVGAALAYARQRCPGLAPRTLLDVGAGPGTASWAATDLWPDLEVVTLLERDERMIRLGKTLGARAASPVLRAATWVREDIAADRPFPAPGYDLVVASYTLGEVAPARRAGVVERLWAAAGDLLLLIEPGTPAGFAVIREARQQVIAARGTVVAPCPHDGTCPIQEGDWCHFARRVTRTRLQRQVKGGTLSYEDEKYAYVALTRGPRPEADASNAMIGRVLRHPRTRPGYVGLELCTLDGLTQTVVTRKDRELFRRARDLSWGDAL